MEEDDIIKLPEEAEKLGAAEDGEVSGDAEIEEGQVDLKAEGVTEGLVETLTEVVTETVTQTDNSGFIGLECGSDGQIEEGQLVSDENGAVLADLATEVDWKDGDAPDSHTIKREAASDSSPQTDIGSKSGVKRMRATSDEQQPTVHVKYSGLSRQSKQKLEELLRRWSEWHVQNASGTLNQIGGSETGEGTYFPALDFGTEKTSVVSFWIENEIRKPADMDVMPVEDASVPLYDRGFALGPISADGSSNLEGQYSRGLELLDAPRCFNCGSYSHSLKECPKPRDNAAVNNSRKQLKSKRNQTAGMRNPSRYYQDTPSGKYEGLRPGVLDAETRRLLGLGEFDPPPWLNRMREIGYPPGYLEPEVEDMPSGITIFADEEIKEVKEDGQEDGEILEVEHVETPQKMSVMFPGINAPIPNNADERIWAARPSNSDRHRNGGGSYANYSSEPRGRHQEHNNRDYRYTPRYGDDFSSPQNSRKNVPAPRSPHSERSMGDRDRNDLPDSEDSLTHRSYSSYSYSSSRRFQEHSNDSDGSKGDQSDYSSRVWDRDDRYRHRSGR